MRPFMRQGEVLETVPGVIITQHSGEGKANQYFLRGFNLDHGSDFAMTVAGTPVNMPTHAHSQGYSDLNFLIPELVAGVQYRRARTSRTRATSRPQAPRTSTTPRARSADWSVSKTGTYGFGRLLLAASPKVGKGHLLGAFETSTNAGPWTVPDSYRKFNGVAALQPGRQRERPLADRAWAITASGTPLRRRRNAPSTPGSSIASARSIRPMAGTRIATASAANGSDSSGQTLTKITGVRPRLRPRL